VGTLGLKRVELEVKEKEKSLRKRKFRLMHLSLSPLVALMVIVRNPLSPIID
jgi:hypothetical protein